MPASAATLAISVAFMRPLPGSRSASFPGWWSGSRQASSMRGAGSKPPAAPSLKTSFCSGGLRLLLRWSASSASAATSRGARRRVALRRAARRTRRVGLRRTAASTCAFARSKIASPAPAASIWLFLRHLRRPRAARGVESRYVELRDGRAASGSAARPGRHVTALRAPRSALRAPRSALHAPRGGGGGPRAAAWRRLRGADQFLRVADQFLRVELLRMLTLARALTRTLSLSRTRALRSR